MTLLDRAGLREPNDCGKFDEPTDPGTDPGGDDDTTGDGRTGVACACNGGRGAPGTGVVLLGAIAIILRRRRR